MRSKFVFFLLSSVVLISLGAGSASAHKVKIFASVDGESISGYGYYTSSARAKNVAVECIGPDGKVFERIKTDDQGEFTIKARYRVDTLLSLSTGDGHGAKWLITADEFPVHLAEYPHGNLLQSDQQKPSVVAENISAEPLAGQQALQLAAVIRQELRPLQEQVNQLRAQIDLQEEKKNVQDVLGGIGYIIGLTGIFFYFAAKRRREQD